MFWNFVVLIYINKLQEFNLIWRDKKQIKHLQIKNSKLNCNGIEQKNYIVAL